MGLLPFMIIKPEEEGLLLSIQGLLVLFGVIG